MSAGKANILQRFEGAVRDWHLANLQNKALGLNPRPFPDVPRYGELQQTYGEELEKNPEDPMCESPFRFQVLENGKTVITTDLPIETPSFN